MPGAGRAGGGAGFDRGWTGVPDSGEGGDGRGWTQPGAHAAVDEGAGRPLGRRLALR